MPATAAKTHTCVALTCPACGGEDCRYDPPADMRCVYCELGIYSHNPAPPMPCPGASCPICEPDPLEQAQDRMSELLGGLASAYVADPGNVEKALRGLARHWDPDNPERILALAVLDELGRLARAYEASR